MKVESRGKYFEVLPTLEGKTMKMIQKGFTLIELMIVIAIIAILAAIALPAYQDYLIRSQVSEAAVLLDGTKTSTTEFFENKGYFPPNNESAGLASSGSIAGTYVEGVDITGSGITVATMGNKANSAVSAKNIELSAITAAGAGSVQFKCKPGSAPIADRYLPTSCRN
jgi:type IV pilus assembly protein PilA